MEVIIEHPSTEISIEAENKEIEIDSTYSVYIEGEPYEGAYEVTPKTTQQTLETAQKVMIQDVLINKIPYYETSNEYGNTIYIGNEV